MGRDTAQNQDDDSVAAAGTQSRPHVAPEKAQALPVNANGRCYAQRGDQKRDRHRRPPCHWRKRDILLFLPLLRRLGAPSRPKAQINNALLTSLPPRWP